MEAVLTALNFLKPGERLNYTVAEKKIGAGRDAFLSILLHLNTTSKYLLHVALQYLFLN